MDRAQIAPDLEIARIVLGLWQVADMERDGATLDPERVRLDLDSYLADGFTTFDMADHYGSSESLIGAYRTAVGTDRLTALTKWVPSPGEARASAVTAAVDRALRRLESSRIDLLQFHAWNYWDPSYLDCLIELEAERAAGRIGHLGMTNCDAAHLEMLLASGFELATNQVSYSLLDRRADGALREVAERHDVQLLAYGTLAGGFLSERWLGAAEPTELSTWSRMKYKRFIDEAGGWEALQAVLSVLAGIAGRHGCSLANVAVRWVLEQPRVAAVIVGARLGESEHRLDNLKVFEFELSPRDRDEIEAVIADLAAIPGDCGDEYRRPPYLTASGDLSHHVDVVPPPWPPRKLHDGRTVVSTGTPWEEVGGYSRAVRVGDRIVVSGTTAAHGDRPIGGDDPAAQTEFVLDKIEGAIRALGGSPTDVVRTRIYVRDARHTSAVIAVHGRRFADVRPANTLVEAGLVGEEALVEIEAEAIVGCSDRSDS